MLKTECVYFECYESREQTKRNIFEYIEIFYNNPSSSNVRLFIPR